MLSHRFDMADVLTAITASTRPAQDEASQNSSQNRKGCLRLLLVKKGHFSLGIWPMTGCPCLRGWPYIIQIWSVLIEIGVINKKDNNEDMNLG